MITESQQDNNIGIVREIPQAELLPENSALSGLVLRLNADYEMAWKLLQDVYSSPSVPIVMIKDLFQRGLEITEVYHGDYRPLQVGPRAILACRTVERSIKNTDRLILIKEERNNMEFADRLNPGSKYQFAVSELSACIR
jgi:hypothetical protein